MTIETRRTVKLNPVWPRYSMACGVLVRLMHNQAEPEWLLRDRWVTQG